MLTCGALGFGDSIAVCGATKAALYAGDYRQGARGERTKISACRDGIEERGGGSDENRRSTPLRGREGGAVECPLVELAGGPGEVQQGDEEASEEVPAEVAAREEQVERESRELGELEDYEGSQGHESDRRPGEEHERGRWEEEKKGSERRGLERGRVIRW